jgi:sortase (surface protein transpeptidase)
MTSRTGQALLRVAITAVLLVAVAASSSLVDDAPLASARPDLPSSAPLPLALPQALPSSPASEPEPETYAERRADPRGEPVRVVIPAIDVDVDLVRVGLMADGAMQVPDFGLAGWYTEGPRPGHAGPAVIVAHVDSRSGPDVFYRLGDLAPDDEIHVVYDSGDEVTFVMTSSEQTPKDRLPVDSIWPTTEERLLTLITCGGEFHRSVRHYLDNVIVYASQ